MKVYNALQNPNIFYLYRHIRLDTNEVFYIGIGRHQKKWKHARVRYINNRNNHWKNIVNISNGDFESQILFDELTQEQIIEKEKEFIKIYGRSDLGLGSLCNLTDGGEGVFNLSEESRKKIGDSRRGEKNPMFGRNDRSDKWKESMKKLKGEGNPNFGKSIPEWHKEINRKTQLGKVHSQETINKRTSKTIGLKRSKEFCDLMKQKALEQSEQRRERTKKQWAERKARGFINLKNK